MVTDDGVLAEILGLSPGRVFYSAAPSLPALRPIAGVVIGGVLVGGTATLLSRRAVPD